MINEKQIMEWEENDSLRNLEYDLSRMFSYYEYQREFLQDKTPKTAAEFDNIEAKAILEYQNNPIIHSRVQTLVYHTIKIVEKELFGK